MKIIIIYLLTFLRKKKIRLPLQRFDHKVVAYTHPRCYNRYTLVPPPEPGPDRRPQRGSWHLFSGPEEQRMLSPVECPKVWHEQSLLWLRHRGPRFGHCRVSASWPPREEATDVLVVVYYRYPTPSPRNDREVRDRRGPCRGQREVESSNAEVPREKTGDGLPLEPPLGLPDLKAFRRSPPRSCPSTASSSVGSSSFVNFSGSGRKENVEKHTVLVSVYIGRVDVTKLRRKKNVENPETVFFRRKFVVERVKL